MLLSDVEDVDGGVHGRHYCRVYYCRVIGGCVCAHRSLVWMSGVEADDGRLVFHGRRPEGVLKVELEALEARK